MNIEERLDLLEKKVCELEQTIEVFKTLKDTVIVKHTSGLEEWQKIALNNLRPIKGLTNNE